SASANNRDPASLLPPAWSPSCLEHRKTSGILQQRRDAIARLSLQGSKLLLEPLQAFDLVLERVLGVAHSQRGEGERPPTGLERPRVRLQEGQVDFSRQVHQLCGRPRQRAG